MSMPPDSMNKRYSESYSDQMNHINNQMNMMSTTQLGYNKLWYPSQSSNPMSMPPDSVNKRYTESYSDQINHVNNQMNMMPAPQVGCNKLWYPNQLPNSMNMPPDSLNKRYPESYPDQINHLNNQMNMMSVTQLGYNKLWGMETIDLLQCRNVLPIEKVESPKIKLHQEFLDSVNCSPDIFRCTLTKIPVSNSLLQKSRLPLGVLIHPFKDLNHLPVIQCSTIVRCHACRTYINPFVYFNDSKRWISI